MKRKPPKPTAPSHDFPAAWYSEPICTRCRKSLSQVEGTGAPCVTDDQIKAGKVFYRLA